MKRILALLLSVIILSGVSAAAAGGVVHADDWYSRHTKDLVFTEGTYKVNAPEGYVSAWYSPEETKLYANIPNGTVLDVAAKYGSRSAVLFTDAKGIERCYWVPTDMLIPYENGAAFLAAHKSEFSEKVKDLRAMKYYETEGTVYLYSFPGSGSVCAEIETIGTGLDLGPVFTYVYTDADGIRWGYLGFYLDWYYNAWICIDDPENGELPAAADSAELYPPLETCADAERLHYPDPAKDNTELLIILAVCAAVVISASAAFFIVRRHTGTPDERKASLLEKIKLNAKPKSPEPLPQEPAEEAELIEPAAAEPSPEHAELIEPASPTKAECSGAGKVSSAKHKPVSKKGRHEK